MKKIYKLNIIDIKEILAKQFKVPINKISVDSCGRDVGDGPYSGSGYYCNISIEVGDSKNNDSI